MSLLPGGTGEGREKVDFLFLNGKWVPWRSQWDQSFSKRKSFSCSKVMLITLMPAASLLNEHDPSHLFIFIFLVYLFWERETGRASRLGICMCVEVLDPEKLDFLSLLLFDSQLIWERARVCLVRDHPSLFQFSMQSGVGKLFATWFS